MPVSAKAVVKGLLILALLLLFIGVRACRPRRPASVTSTPVQATCIPNPDNHPPSLLTVPGATSIEYLHCPPDANQLLYGLDRAFPARDVIDSVSQQLAAQGWTPVKDKFFEPGQLSSQAVGWERHVERKQEGDDITYAWWGNWTNAQSDVVWYNFQYVLRYKGAAPPAILEGKADPSVSQLNVAAAVIPAASAQKQRKAIEDAILAGKQIKR